MRTMLTTKPWRLPCSVCGEVSAETYSGLHFCESCFGWFRAIESMVDFKATPSKVVEHMKKKLEAETIDV